MHIFYTPDIESNQLYTLNEEESKHCLRVLRLKPGDVVYLTDGRGSLFEAVVTSPDPRACSVTVTKITPGFHKRNFYLHMAIAPTKNTDRFEWFLEKATEIGIDEITPVFCARSERRNFKTERAEKVIIAAMKQSLIAKKPVLNEPLSFDVLMNESVDRNVDKFIAHCADGKRFTIKETYQKGRDAVVLIGPEGDFTREEIDRALSHQFRPVTLGMNRLRTETAGMVACCILNMINED